MYLFGFAIFLALYQHYKYAVTLIVVCISIIFINNIIVIPFFLKLNHLSEIPTIGYFSLWGKTKPEIILNLLTYPFQILFRLFGQGSGIWRLYLPMLFIPLFDLFAFSASVFAILLHAIVSSENMYSYKDYYPLTLSVIAYIGAINIIEKIRLVNIKLVMTLIIILSWIWGTGLQRYYPIKLDEYTNFKKGQLSLQSISINNKIITSNNLFPHLINNKNIQTGLNMNKVESSYYFLSPIGDLYPYDKNAIKAFIKKLNNCRSWGSYYLCDNRGSVNKNSAV